ncbi:MAG: DUF2147 domain-containing protein [Prevotellaceae bacterium]|nr:DUF2147 domain-containing protein [Prevotellaceae bacterium]
MAGLWVSVDDKSGREQSIVQIFKATNGMYYGKLLKLLDERYPKDILCVLCEGEDKNKPVEGLLIIRNMKPDGNKLVGGTIFDPETGNTYHCTISLEGEKTLKLRGSLDKRGILGRSQYWIKKQ